MSKLAEYQSDVTDLDAIIKAMYEVISGPAGHARDWKRFRNLYILDARLMPAISRPGETAAIRVLSPEDYIRRVELIFAKEDFWERETDRQAQTFGHVAHVLSAYESLRSPDGPAFERGMNSVQLFNDNIRWWIVSVMWNTPRQE
jgi:hypothetical protein